MIARLRRALRVLGPGVIAGAADDDPAGIATYSIAGAQFGTSLLWTAFFTWPLMTAVQLTCARIGMVTGRGLMAALRARFPRPLLVAAAAALFLANTLNVGADLAAMADAVELFTGWPAPWVMVALGGAIGWATVELPYRRLAAVLKWLALALFAYVATALLSHPDWDRVLEATVLPELPGGRGGWATVVAILGTTISPYLFFWQAAEEVEEEKSLGRRTARQRRGATAAELRDRRVDVLAGTLVSNVVMYFIILTAALTLHRAGRTDVATSADAAAALAPLAGRFAAVLFAAGIVGTGLLAIPTLVGSAAYAAAEVFNWRTGLDQPYRRARAFYVTVLLGIAGGLLIRLAEWNPVRALFWSSVVNGLLAPVLLVGIVLVAADARLMFGQPSRRWVLAVVGATAVLMTGAAALMALG